jgi:hypothetical protein
MIRDAEIVELALRRVAASRDCDISPPSKLLEAVADQIAKIIQEAPRGKEPGK